MSNKFKDLIINNIIVFLSTICIIIGIIFLILDNKYNFTTEKIVSLIFIPLSYILLLFKVYNSEYKQKNLKSNINNLDLELKNKDKKLNETINQSIFDKHEYESQLIEQYIKNALYSQYSNFIKEKVKNIINTDTISYVNWNIFNTYIYKYFGLFGYDKDINNYRYIMKQDLQNYFKNEYIKNPESKNKKGILNKLQYMIILIILESLIKHEYNDKGYIFNIDSNQEFINELNNKLEDFKNEFANILEELKK